MHTHFLHTDSLLMPCNTYMPNLSYPFISIFSFHFIHVISYAVQQGLCTALPCSPCKPLLPRPFLTLAIPCPLSCYALHNYSYRCNCYSLPLPASSHTSLAIARLGPAARCPALVSTTYPSNRRSPVYVS